MRTLAIGALLTAVLIAGCYPPIAIEPAQLPDGAVGQPYSVTFTFTGDDIHDAYVFGDLPDGLRFAFDRTTDGATLGGIPTTPGTSTFTVNAYGPQFMFGGSDGKRDYTLVVR